jgi:hypothetical protein
MGLLHPVDHKDIKPIIDDTKMPEFCGPERWVISTCEQIEKGADEVDGDDRIPPIGLVRFSRGGKSRVLYEIGRYLREKYKKERKDIVVINISFNDYSPLDPTESTDPVEALCRRICFWFLQKRTDLGNFAAQYNEIRGDKVDSAKVLNYIGGRPCILLIDELNKLDDTKLISEFLKRNFLIAKGRFFVFTSHVLTTEESLRTYMDGNSNRPVTIRKLPIIPSLNEARKKLFSTLTPDQAMFCGLSPALIHTTQKGSLPVNLALKPATFEDTQVQQLCQTFVNGDYTLVPAPFLSLMDTDTDQPGTTSNILWVPVLVMQIMHFINRWSEKTCSKGVFSLCSEIGSALQDIPRSKELSGGGWEYLFYAALLIRIAAQENHPILNLPITNDEWKTYKIELDDFADVDEYRSDMTDPSEYIQAIPRDRKKQLSVYKPSIATFELYDIFLVVWDNKGTRTITGYQLKSGDRLPDNDALESEVDKSYVIRGKATQKDKTPLRGWWRPSQQTINSFFGVSGVNWTPDTWEKLKSGGLNLLYGDETVK